MWGCGRPELKPRSKYRENERPHIVIVSSQGRKEESNGEERERENSGRKANIAFSSLNSICLRVLGGHG
ncbi:hypothetical protein HN51_053168 [Arachis hypogaea]